MRELALRFVLLTLLVLPACGDSVEGEEAPAGCDPACAADQTCEDGKCVGAGCACDSSDECEADCACDDDCGVACECDVLEGECDAGCECDAVCCAEDKDCGDDAECKDGACACRYLACEAACCAQGESCTEGVCKEAEAPGAAVEITVESPERAVFIAAPGPVTVSGKVSAVGEVSSFTVNGDDVSVGEDGAFSVEITAGVGLNTVVLKAAVAAGASAQGVRSFIFGDLAGCLETLEQAAGVHVGQLLLDNDTKAPDDLARILELLVAELDMEDYVEDKVDIGGAFEAEITSIEQGPVEVEITPVEGFLEARFTVTGTEVGYHVVEKVAEPTLDSTGTAILPTVVVEAHVLLGVGDDGLPTVTLEEVRAQVNDLRVSEIGEIPQVLVDLFAPGLEELAEAAVEDAVKKAAEENVGTFMNRLRTLRSIDLPAPAELEVLLDSSLESIDVKPGGVVAMLNAPVPCTKTETEPYGVARTPGNMPGVIESAGIGFAFADDLLNAVLLAAWEAGLMSDVELGAAELDSLGVDLAALPIEGIDSIALSAHLPLVTRATTPTSPEELVLYFGDVLAKVSLGALGEVELWASGVFPVDFVFTDDRRVSLDLSNTEEKPWLAVEPVSTPEGVDEAKLILVVEKLLPMALARSLKDLPGIPVPELPLSAFAGLAGLGLGEGVLVVEEPELSIPAGSQGYVLATGHVSYTGQCGCDATDTCDLDCLCDPHCNLPCECDVAGECDADCDCDHDCCEADADCGENGSCVDQLCGCAFEPCGAICCGPWQSCDGGRCSGTMPLPLITIEAPARGAFVEDEGELVLTGAVSLGVELKSFTVDGVDHTVAEDGSFSVPLTPRPGLNTVVVQAENVDGGWHQALRSFVFGDIAGCGETISHTVALQLGVDVIDNDTPIPDDLAGIVELAVSRMEVLDYVENPVKVAGLVDVTVTSVEMGPLELDLTPDSGHLAVWARVRDTAVAFATDQGSGTASLPVILVRAKVGLGAGAEGEPLVSAGEVSADVLGLRVDDPGDLDPVLIEAAMPLIELEAEDAIAETVESALSANVGSFSQTLAELGDFTLEEPLEVSVSLAASFEALEATAEGIRAMLTTAVNCPEGEAPHGVARTPGALPPMAGNGGVISAVADDLVNQVLLSAWQRGLLSGQTITIAELEAMGAPPLESPYHLLESLRFDAALPLFVQPSGAEAPGDVVVSLGDVAVTAAVGALGEATFWVSGEIPMDVAMSAEAGLSFKVAGGEGGAPSFVVEPAGDPSRFDYEGLVSLMEALIPVMAAEALNGLEPVPLPTVALADFAALAALGLDDVVLGLGEPQLGEPGDGSGYLRVSGGLSYGAECACDQAEECESACVCDTDCVVPCDCDTSRECDADCDCDRDCCLVDAECGANGLCGAGVCSCAHETCAGACCAAGQLCKEEACTGETPVPTITVDLPTRGLFASTGDLVTLSGQVAGDQTLASFTVNGETKQVTAGSSFEIPVSDPEPGLNTLVVRAENTFGKSHQVVRSFIYGDLSTCDETIEGAVGARLGPVAIDDDDDDPDDLAAVLELALEAAEMLPYVTNPIVVSTTVVITKVTTTATVTKIEQGPVSLDLTPQDGYIEVAATVTGTKAYYDAVHSPGGPSSGHVLISTMEVTAKVYLEVQDGDVVTTVTDVVVTINESDVTINDSSFPSALTGMFKSAVVDEMKVAVAGAVDKAAPANVSAFTAALEEPYEVDLPAPFGQKVSVEPVFEDISVDTGGLLATLGAKVACDDSWDAEHGVPLTPGQMPDSTGAAGISSSIADDVMGLVLLDAWEHGMLVDHTLDHEGMSDLGMWPLDPPYDIIEEIHVDARLPLFGLAAAPEAEEHLKVYAGDVLVTLPMGSLGDASFWVAAEAAVTVEPDSETGSVLVLQTAPDRVKASVEMVTAPEGLDQAGLVTLVQSAFATIFAKSVSGMEAVPLPEIPLSGFPDLASYAELQDRAIVVGSPQIDVPAGSQGYLEAQGEMVTPE